MARIAWEDVLRRDDIVGGEIETQEDGDVYRGPIESIELKNNYVSIKCAWVAKRLEDGRWVKWHITASGVAAECKPNDIGDGRIQYHMPMLGMAVIFPKGGSKLDPTKVEGLAL